MLKIVVLSISFVLLSAMAMNGILPEIRDSLSITQTQSELLVTTPSIATLIFVVLSNSLIKKMGMKRVVIMGLILAGLGGIMPVFYAESYAYILVGRFLLGAGKGLIFTSSVSYINMLFDEKERATLLGYRSSVEQLGQSTLTLGLGALASISWNFSFIIYVVYFLIAILVAFKIPQVEMESEETKRDKAKKLPLAIYPLALFTGMIAVSGAMIGIRFPAMAAEIMGEGYNSSVFIAIKPLLGIVAAAFFGKLTALLGKKLLYIGVLFLIAAQLLIGFSNGNFMLLISGFLLSSFVLAWIVPIIIHTISKITTGAKQRTAMACVLICANVGLFMMPFIVQFLEWIAGSSELTAPYPIAAIIVSIVLVALVFLGNNKAFKVKVGLK